MELADKVSFPSMAVSSNLNLFMHLALFLRHKKEKEIGDRYLCERHLWETRACNKATI